MLFDFALVSKHIRTTSGLPPSYVDYGFGSDKRNFAGSHRFVVNRKDEGHGKDANDKTEGGSVELYVEGFCCNPMVNRGSWVEYMPWIHYWYGTLLWAEAVRAVLRR